MAQAEGRIHTSLGPHSPYVCPPEFLTHVVELAAANHLPIHLHVAESQEQVENSRERHGKTPVEQLNALGVFDHHTIAAHSLALTPDDRRYSGRKGRLHRPHADHVYETRHADSHTDHRSAGERAFSASR